MMISAISFAQKTKKLPVKKPATSVKPISKIEYGNWLFIKSDRAVQYRFAKVKEENNAAYFKVQFRINFEDKIFCGEPNCFGYKIYFGYPSSIVKGEMKFANIKMMNTYKEIYDFPEPVIVQLSYPDGSSILFDKEQSFLAKRSDGSVQQAHIFYNCIDVLEAKFPYVNCRDFDEKTAVILQ